MNDLTINEAQKNQPWTVPYSGGVELARKEGFVPHILGSHNCLHAAKTVGKLSAVFEEADHKGNLDLSPAQLQTVKDMAADLAAEALRFATLYGFSLADEMERRAKEKNGRGYR